MNEDRWHFMLELIRNHKNLFSILFIIAGSALILSMFANPYSGSMGASGGNTVVAQVEGQKITIGELLGEVKRRRELAEERIEEQLKGSDKKSESRKFLEQYFRAQWSPERSLEDLINRKFRLAVSQKMGIEASEPAIADSVRQVPAFQKEGKFDKAQYTLVLKANNYTPERFEDSVREDIKLAGMIKAVRNSMSVISNAEVNLENRFKKRMNLELLTLSPEKFSSSLELSQKDIQAFSENPAQQAQLQSYFDRNISQYQKSEEVHARHILITEEEGGLVKANEVLANIKAGKISFEEAAKKFSSDKSNSERGGDLGFFPRGMMDPAFEKASFDLKSDNELVNAPVKSSFGYHLIQRLGYQAAETKPLNDVKKEIAEKVLIEIKRGEKMRAFAKTLIENAKVPSPASLKKLGLTWSPVSWSALDSSLGPIQFIDDYRAQIMQLSKENQILKELIPQGENLIVVKWVKPNKENQKETLAKAGQVALEKVSGAFEFTQNRSLENLTKQKKIYRNAEALAQIKASFGDAESSPLGR